MARMFQLASETSQIFEQYVAIHDQAFGFSIRGLLGSPSRNGSMAHAERARRLEELATSIQEMRREIAALQDAELTKRSKNEVRSTLLDYTGALAESITRLRAICENLHREAEGIDGYTGYSEERLRLDKIGYDDSIQLHKRLGARLTDLFAKV